MTAWCGTSLEPGWRAFRVRCKGRHPLEIEHMKARDSKAHLRLGLGRSSASKSRESVFGRLDHADIVRRRLPVCRRPISQPADEGLADDGRTLYYRCPDLILKRDLVVGWRETYQNDRDRNRRRRLGCR